LRKTIDAAFSRTFGITVVCHLKSHPEQNPLSVIELSLNYISKPIWFIITFLADIMHKSRHKKESILMQIVPSEQSNLFSTDPYQHPFT
jgi:hypothetical protein